MTVRLRKARMGDVRAMHELLSHFADKRELLPRAIAEVYENLQQFYVAEEGDRIIGTCALYVTWDNLAEVKALAVEEPYQGRGIGKQLLEACLATARDLDIRRVFTLTLRPGFFERFQFGHVSKDQLPHKVWTECVRCVFFPNRCVEYAMVKDLPGTGPEPLPLTYRDLEDIPAAIPAGAIVPSEPEQKGPAWCLNPFIAGPWSCGFCSCPSRRRRFRRSSFPFFTAPSVPGRWPRASSASRRKLHSALRKP